jgi:hypothetical protein
VSFYVRNRTINHKLPLRSIQLHGRARRTVHGTVRIRRLRFFLEAR